MEPIRVRCRSCGKEVEALSGKTVTCGCPNMVTISNDVISAEDLNKVIMLNTYSCNQKTGLSTEQLEWQESRRNRKIRKLDFEIR
tara:strand:- start:495 stop:749 length:255 start_codon:yes stop_codon:yes gene_type:complete